MTTAIAYIGTFVIYMLSGTLVGLLFIFVLGPIQLKVDNEAFSGYVHLLDNVVSRSVGAWLATLLFSWLAVPFSPWALALPVVFYALQDQARIRRAWNTDRHFFELGFGMGDLVGFPLGYLLITGLIPTKYLFVIGVALLIPLIYMYATSRMAGYEFWNLAAKLPDEAYEWFKSEECWYLDLQEAKNQGVDTAGPFRLSIPSLGRSIQVWGDSSRYEDSQNRFVQLYKQNRLRYIP